MKSQNVFLIAILVLAALGIGGCTLLITVQLTKDTLFRFIQSSAETLKNIFPRQLKRSSACPPVTPCWRTHDSSCGQTPSKENGAMAKRILALCR
jgi:hypothetical protein